MNFLDYGVFGCISASVAFGKNQFLQYAGVGYCLHRGAHRTKLNQKKQTPVFYSGAGASLNQESVCWFKSSLRSP